MISRRSVLKQIFGWICIPSIFSFLSTLKNNEKKFTEKEITRQLGVFVAEHELNPERVAWKRALAKIGVKEKCQYNWDGYFIPQTATLSRIENKHATDTKEKYCLFVFDITGINIY